MLGAQSGRKYSVAPPYELTLRTGTYVRAYEWAPAGIFPVGAKPRGLTKRTYFSARPRRERNFSRFFRRFRLNLRVFDASAGGASENFRVFSTGTAYDVIIFKFQEGGTTAPGCPPLRAPMLLPLISEFATWESAQLHRHHVCYNDLMWRDKKKHSNS